jgi:LSD1 subclass zinc finger protein
LPILAQLGWVIDHVRAAIGSRACDVEVGGGALHVIGGPWHGFHASLADLQGDRAIKLENGVLSLTPSHGRALNITIPNDPDERTSLEALAASLGALAAARDTNGAPRPIAMPAHAELEVLRCTSCGAPLTPTRGSSVECAYCKAANSIPAELASRLEKNEIVDARRRIDEALCVRLQKQPGPALANALAFSGGSLSIALTAIATFLAAMMAFSRDDIGGVPRFGGLALIECGLALSVLALVRSSLASRTALRVLTLGFSAIPGAQPGAADCCRNCGAPLPAAAPSRVLIRCVYCDADNLGSLDLAVEAAVVKRFSAGELSPARALVAVRRRRWVSRVQLLAGAALLCCGVAWHLASAAIQPDARTVTLPELTPAPYATVEAGPGAAALVSEARISGDVLALWPNGADVDSIVSDAGLERHRVSAPHGELQASDVAGAPLVPFGTAYARRAPSEPLLVTAAASFVCMEPSGTRRVLYGAGALADPLLEDPEATGGCSALLTTRAGENGHYRVRRFDGSGMHVALTDARQAALAPDGSTLVASKLRPMKGVFDLALFAPGSAPRLLTHGPINAGYAAWSPDGRRVAFLSVPRRDPIQFHEFTGATQLFVLDLNGHLSQLTTGGEPSLVRPVWTARGIYFTQSDGDDKHPKTTLLRAIPK